MRNELQRAQQAITESLEVADFLPVKAGNFKFPTYFLLLFFTHSY